jgi:hypothetical protein
MFTQKIENILSKEVSSFLTKINPTTPYWKGNHSWQDIIKLREQIHSRRNKNGFKETDQKFILKWGGIHNFSSYGLLQSALKELSNESLTYENYSRISSMSKLFSFYTPEKYFILDARVSLTINHFISTKNTGDLLIPFQPSKSKGGKVKSALIKLRNKKHEYENIGQAYLAYNDLVLRIFKNINIPNKLPPKPELVEMVLFSLAPDYAK